MIKNRYVNRGIDFIMNSLDSDISVDDVAAYCNLSKFHFCRTFKAETGESVYRFIKRMKMEQSAFKLKTESKASVTEIGFHYGYSSSNYSWAFRKHHKVSPAAFRRGIDRSAATHPFLSNEVTLLKTFDEYKRMVEIQHLEDFRVIYERRIGNYLDLSDNWSGFIERNRRYMKADTLLIERSYDDPSIANVKNCLYDICMTVSGNCASENEAIIEGGRYAVYRFEGSIDGIFAAYQGLFRVWLPQSGYRMADRYGLDIYRYVDCEKRQVVMDICIPVK